MDLVEYEKIKFFSYFEYCQYLQEKYGIGKYDYMTKNWNKNKKASRTNEGLIAHHRYEDTAIMLANKDFAKNFPFEWQVKENLIYCDYLEHLLLHVMICENPSKNKVDFMDVGIGGVVNFLVPELNDLYSGWVSKQAWRLSCHNLVIADKEVYFVVLKRFISKYSSYSFFSIECLFTSCNEQYGLWTNSKNMKLYREIRGLMNIKCDEILSGGDEVLLMVDLTARYNVSNSTIRKSFFHYGLPVEKVGNKWVVSKRALIEWELQKRFIPYGQKGRIFLPAWTEKKNYLRAKMKEAKKDKNKLLIADIQAEMKKYNIIPCESESEIFVVCMVLSGIGLLLAIDLFLETIFF